MELYSERYFQHFKGGLYKLLFIAKDSESIEKVVVYQAMYGRFDIWVRPEKRFFDFVNLNEEEIPRFKELTKEEFLCLQSKIENI